MSASNRVYKRPGFTKSHYFNHNISMNSRSFNTDVLRSFLFGMQVMFGTRYYPVPGWAVEAVMAEMLTNYS